MIERICIESIESCLFIAEHMIRGAKEEDTIYPYAVREGARDYLTRACELACWHAPQVFPHVEIERKSRSKSNVTVNMGGD